jgi:hypothetical protein
MGFSQLEVTKNTFRSAGIFGGSGAGYAMLPGDGSHVSVGDNCGQNIGAEPEGRAEKLRRSRIKQPLKQIVRLLRVGTCFLLGFRFHKLKFIQKFQ